MNSPPIIFLLKTLALKNNLQRIIYNKKKPLTRRGFYFRGIVRIRTGVRGFADRCLAARPRRLISGEQI